MEPIFFCGPWVVAGTRKLCIYPFDRTLFSLPSKKEDEPIVKLFLFISRAFGYLRYILRCLCVSWCVCHQCEAECVCVQKAKVKKKKRLDHPPAALPITQDNRMPQHLEVCQVNISAAAATSSL